MLEPTQKKTDEMSYLCCSETNGKQKQNSPAAAGGTVPTVAPAGPCRMTRSRVNRRNTMDCAILNEMFIDDDSKHTDKRSKQLLRESERDMKRASVALIGPTATGLAEAIHPKLHLEERAESMPVTMRNGTNGLQSGPLLVSFLFCVTSILTTWLSDIFLETLLGCWALILRLNLICNYRQSIVDLKENMVYLN